MAHYKPLRDLVSQLPKQHAIHDFWWSRKAKKSSRLTDWNLEKNLAFIHIPKCAGTSVYRGMNMPEHPLGTHVPIIGYESSSPDKFKQITTFAFSRNPWDRFVSAFHYLAFKADLEGAKQFSLTHFGTEPDFGLFLDRFCASNWLQNAVMAHPHFRPQSHYACSADGRLNPSHMFRIEDGIEQLSALCETFDVPFKAARENLSARADYQEYYTPKTRDKIGQIYARDVALSQYVF